MSTASKLLPLGLLFLGACTMGPDYKRPDTHADAEWAEVPSDKVGEESIEHTWWTRFEDPVLERYIEEALRENRNLRAAGARIQRARALRRETNADFYPTLDAEGGYSRQRASEAVTTNGGSRTRTNYQAGLAASWEIDLFGGVRRADEASEARLQLTVEERRGILLTVLAEVARNYYDIRGIQKRIDITEQNIALQTQTFNLVDRLFQLGEASEFDITRARGQLQTTESRLPELDAELKSGIYRLSILLGQPPAYLLEEMSESSPLPSPPDLVPVGQLSDIVRRRPDIRAAERELAAATADVGAATAGSLSPLRAAGRVSRISNSIDGCGIPPTTATISVSPAMAPTAGGAVRAPQAEKRRSTKRWPSTSKACWRRSRMWNFVDPVSPGAGQKVILQAALESRQRSWN